MMTLAVAQGVRLGYDQAVREQATREAIIDAMHQYGRDYPDAGYGRRFVRWLRSGERTPYGSFGNGSAMRVSPVGWAYQSLEEVHNYATISAAVSHDHPEGIKGACATAEAIFLARNGADKPTIAKHITGAYGYDLTRTPDDIRPTYVHKQSCQESVPEALCCFLYSEDFEDALRNAVSLGGDSDTQAAICCGVAEAFYGGVPEAIAAQVLQCMEPALRIDLTTWRTWLKVQEKL